MCHTGEADDGFTAILLTFNMNRQSLLLFDRKEIKRMTHLRLPLAPVTVFMCIRKMTSNKGALHNYVKTRLVQMFLGSCGDQFMQPMLIADTWNNKYL